jgi:hypothetical protein
MTTTTTTIRLLPTPAREYIVIDSDNDSDTSTVPMTPYAYDVRADDDNSTVPMLSSHIPRRRRRRSPSPDSCHSDNTIRPRRRRRLVMTDLLSDNGDSDSDTHYVPSSHPVAHYDTLHAHARDFIRGNISRAEFCVHLGILDPFYDAAGAALDSSADVSDGSSEGGDEDSGDEEQPNSDDEAAIDNEDLSSQCDSNASYAPSESGDSSPSVSSSSSGASSE